MKKSYILILCLSLLAFSVFAPAGEIIEKYWERACGVQSEQDDVRSLAVWAEGDLLATINRTSGPDAIRLFNATTGLMEEVIESLDMTGIPEELYAVVSGDFSEDGAFFACSLSHQAGVNLRVYYWATVEAVPVQILNQTYSTRLGDALDVIGKVGDNSVSILIGGNSDASQPVRITYNGTSWTASTLANAVRAQDIAQVAGGGFYATYAGGDIIRYNADGTSDETIVTGAEAQTSIAVDSTRNLIYAMGYAPGSNYLSVYDLATGDLLADLSADPLDFLGDFSGTANGSSGVAMVEYPGGTYIYAMSERMGCARYSYSTQLTVGAGGDFASIQEAISSYCLTGGTNTDVVMPLVISIDPTGGPYDEAISLIMSSTGYGDIAGDLVLKSAGPGKAVVKLQKGDPTRDDGLPVFQDIANVIFKNLILCHSQTNPLTRDLVVLSESSNNSQMNWVEFYGCILTDITEAGDPMITSAADAFLEPVPSGSPTNVDGRTNLRFGVRYGVSAQVTFSQSLFMEQCVNYRSRHMNYIYMNGAPTQARFHNTIFSHGSAAGIFSISWSDGAKLIVTGDDQTNRVATGDTINCSAIYEFNRRLFYDYSSGIHTRNSEHKLVLVVKNTIITTSRDHTQSRAISSYASNDVPAGGQQGHNTDIFKIHDVIIDVPRIAIMDDVSNDPATAMDIRRTTIRTPLRGIQFTGDSSSTAYVTDSIIADCTAVFYREATDPTVNVVLTHCGIPLEGPYAVGEVISGNVNLIESNTVYADPMFITTNILSPSYFDVRGHHYANAASDGGPLRGGGNFIGGTETSVDPLSWECYR